MHPNPNTPTHATTTIPQYRYVEVECRDCQGSGVLDERIGLDVERPMQCYHCQGEGTTIEAVRIGADIVNLYTGLTLDGESPF